MTRRNLLPNLLVALGLWAPAPTQGQEIVVSRVELQGASDPRVARYLTVKAGDRFDPEAVRSSVLTLAATDLFDEVWAEQETEATGNLRLIFKVVETPRLGELVFVTRSAGVGSDQPVESSLSKELALASGLRAREAFRGGSLLEASNRMTEWLRANGYPRTTLEIEPLPEDVNSKQPGVTRDVRVRLLQAKRETLVSSRIDGWPGGLPAPRSPAKLGDVLTTEKVTEWRDELLSVLWKSAYYRAQIRTESVEGDLVFFVTAGPPFDLKLDVLVPKERDDARKRFEQEGLSQDALEETMSAIEADYVKRGYREVEVDFQEVPNPPRMTGEFVVRSGALWTLAAVEYQTNGAPGPTPDSAKLQAGRPWVDADIEDEKTRIRNALIEEGHAGALVSHEESGEPESAKVLFKIVPGSLTIIGSVAIEGAPAADQRGDVPVAELVTRETAPFRNSDIARDRSALLASLRDDGYVDARVEPTADFSDDRTSVAVVFRVTPGPRVRVGRILVVGLEDTKEKVVLRESRLKEGEVLSYQKLLDTQSGLSATGLFASVEVRELASEAEDDRRNIIIQVREGPRTVIVPGLGWGEVERVRASLELTRLNLGGAGRTASLFLRSSFKGSRGLLSLTDPYAFGRRQTVNVQLYAEDDRSREAFEFERVGFQAQTLFPLGSSTLLARYTFQKTTTTTLETDCSEVDRGLCDGRISGPSLGLIHDTRSDALDPRRGSLLSIETLLSAAAIGGDSFVKGSAFFARYEEVRAGTVIAASARVGLSRAFGDSVELPLSERFFAGGASLMRGFKIDGVGPGRFSSANVFIPNGGNALVAAAIEARIDIMRGFGFQVFAETGNVFTRVSAIRLGQLREVAGIGLTYRSPFGPLRLDWGFKLDRRPGESLQQLHVGVGYAF